MTNHASARRVAQRKSTKSARAGNSNVELNCRRREDGGEQARQKNRIIGTVRVAAAGRLLFGAFMR